VSHSDARVISELESRFHEVPHVWASLVRLQRPLRALYETLLIIPHTVFEIALMIFGTCAVDCAHRRYGMATRHGILRSACRNR